MLEVYICEKFGWTHQQYLEQPKWFVDSYIGKMKVEARKNTQQK
jgi:hypothetical protein